VVLACPDHDLLGIQIVSLACFAEEGYQVLLVDVTVYSMITIHSKISIQTITLKTF
jgi:hypothetical protein